MSKALPDSDSSECLTTGVYHDGAEVAARARSAHSRSAHDPVTDADGTPVFYAPTDADEPGPCKVVDADHPDGEPRPACGLPSTDRDDVPFRLAPVTAFGPGDKCSYCDGSNGDPSKGAAKKSFARVMRYGSDWGDA